jgi:hypothetical protein
MFDAVVSTGCAACSCPLCGGLLPITLERTVDPHHRRYEDAAQAAVLDHLFVNHASVIEHSTVAAIGALLVAGTGTV